MIAADIAVTIAGRHQVDCLQKVYPVGPFICAAFAGSVRIGFRLIADLARFIKPPEAGIAAWPRAAIHEWRRRARKIFADSNPEHRAGDSALIVAGVDPEQCQTEPWPKTHVAVLRAPGYEATYADSLRPVSIGSGERVEYYNNAISDFVNTQPKVFEFEANGRQAIGRVMFQYASRAASRSPRDGISRHMHLCTARRGNIEIITNDYLLDGEKMPEVCITWPTFRDKLTSLGYTLAEAEAAVCGAS